MRTYVSIATVVGIAAGLLGAASAAPVAAADPAGDLVGRSFPLDLSQRPADRPANARAGEGEQLLSASATFATRIPGMPAAGSRPDQQLVPGATLSISYGYHWETDVLEYHFEVRPASAGLRPPTAPPDYVRVGLGVLSGTSCTLDTVSTDITSENFPDHLLYGSGDATEKPNAGRWDCAALVVQDQAATVTYDAYVTPLTVTTATPELSLTTPRRDRLVPKVWTRIPVEVANASAEGIDARDVAVTGSGKGIKVRPTELGTLDGGDDTEGHVWVRLTKARATLRLAVTEKGETVDEATVKVRKRPAPAPPRAGAWSAANVDFSVRGGKVRGFRVRAVTTCGGYPDIPTTTQNYYSFVTTPIPRNNEVVGTEKGNQGGDAAYSAYLDLEFVSRTKAVGTFRYFGPANCRAVHTFKAKVRR